MQRATTNHNESQQATTSHNETQKATTSHKNHNDQEQPITSHNDPQRQPQKSPSITIPVKSESVEFFLYTLFYL